MRWWRTIGRLKKLLIAPRDIIDNRKSIWIPPVGQAGSRKTAHFISLPHQNSKNELISMAFCGTGSNKRIVSEIVSRALRHLGGEDNYRNSQHLYLAGTDATELKVARKICPEINSQNLHAAECNYRNYSEAFEKLKLVGNQKALYFGSYLDLIKNRQLSGKLGVVWLDFCGTLSSNIDGFRSVLPHLCKGAVFAISFTFARDGLKSARLEQRLRMRDSIRAVDRAYQDKYKDNWLALKSAAFQTAIIAGNCFPRIWFSLAVSYKQFDLSRAAMPMLVLIGRISSKRLMFNPPCFFLECLSEETWSFREVNLGWTRDGNKLAGLKAHLPINYKRYCRNVGFFGDYNEESFGVF